MRLPICLLTVGLLLTACGPGGKATPTPSATTPPAIQGVEVFTGLSHNHLAKGQYPQSYPQSPPVGGPHSPVWLKCQVYDQPVPKENAVHSMEHGGVWITYDTDLAPSQIAQLAQLAKLSPEYVLISPYSGQSSPVIATTWGLQLKVTGPDDPRLVAFIEQYAGGNQGGERGAGCASTGATLAQVVQYDASQR